MIKSVEDISVCVCTFKRLYFLNRLLENLCEQETQESFIFSIIVVDNDAAKSAESIVASFRENNEPKIHYFTEPQQGYSHVRNKALKSATGDLIAFIDDDEYPDSTRWLLNLYRTLRSSNADGVLGPVIPHFEAHPPKWVIDSRLLELDPKNWTGQ